MSAHANVVDVTDQSFRTEVLEESFRRPVVVDFWADWCQPCRLIGPVLERLAEEHGGEFLLAKLDVDSNPEAAAAFQIRGIPAVKAFKDGRLASEFIGAIPEQAIRQWLVEILPSEADRLAFEGEGAELDGRAEDAERLFRQALAADARHVRASLGLARIALARKDFDEARRQLEPLRPDPEAERLLATIEVSGWASPDGEGPFAQAERAAAEGRYQEALEVFLAAVRDGTEEQRAEAREAMLKIFSVLGEEDPLAEEYRRKLAAALF